MAQLLDRKVEEALNAVGQFSDFLEKETQALKNSDFKGFEALQDRKIELAQSYQDALLAFEEEIDELPNLPESAKEKLRASHTRFTTVAETNQQALLAATEVSERVVNLIIGAAKRTVMDTPNYGATGMQDLSSKIPVHFNLNEVL